MRIQKGSNQNNTYEMQLKKDLLNISPFKNQEYNYINMKDNSNILSSSLNIKEGINNKILSSKNM